MKPGLTIDDLITIYGPIIRALPSNKPRDPVERRLLTELDDPTVHRESDGLTRVAGERPTSQNTRVAR